VKAAAAVEAMQDLLLKATKKIWVTGNSEQQKEEERRDITPAMKRDSVATKEWRASHPDEARRAGEGDEEEEEGDPGEVTRDGGGKVLTKACSECGLVHGGTKKKCRRCGTKLPSGARKPQWPKRRRQVTREEDGYWLKVAHEGGNAAGRTSEQKEWERTENLWTKMVVSRGRGRVVDGPEGSPRGPNPNAPSIDEDYEDDDDNNNEDNIIGNTEGDGTGNEESQEEEETEEIGQGRTKIRRVTTLGGRMV